MFRLQNTTHNQDKMFGDEERRRDINIKKEKERHNQIKPIGQAKNLKIINT